MFDRIVIMNMDEFLIQNINLCGHLAKCGIVEKHHGFPGVRIVENL